jgi:cobalt-zinc-cadmium efflux system membrane fusion protein
MRNLDADKTGLVHCHFHEYARELVPGMAITAMVELESTLLPAVPQEAVLLYKGKHYVFVENQANTFRLREVLPGVTENGLTALQRIDSSITGKKVVTKGAFNLLGSLMKSEEEE